MKSRHGYVSNSSSSSFVIMYNDDSRIGLTSGAGAEPVEYITIDDMLEMFENQRDWSSDSTGILARGYEFMMSYINEKDEWGGHFYDEERDEVLKKVNELKGEWTNGSIVKVSYHDEFLNKVLKAFAKAGQIVILNEQEM